MTYMLLTAALAVTAALPRTTPRKVGLDETILRKTDAVIDKAITDGYLPGAVLAVVRHGKMAYLEAYGCRQTYPVRSPMTTDAIFDIASCSKSVSTAISAMILYERGMLDLEAPVSLYLPDFDDRNGSIRVKHLLTHTSGLPAYAPISELSKRYGAPNPEGLLSHICHVKRDFAAGKDFQYSCINYITLQHIIQRISGMSLRDFAKRNIFKPLGMKHTDYLPEYKDASRWRNLIAPTTVQNNGAVLCGLVHDPLARIMNGGISGNAGVFSCAEDLATLCAMLQNGGEWKGKRILKASTIEVMRTVPQFAKAFGRTYGWDVSSPYSSCNGTLFSRETYGHTGFTGTSIVIDPINDCAVILLSNAVHPTEGKGGIVRLRKEISDIVASAIIQE